MESISQDIKSKIQHIESHNIWVNEANFALQNITNILTSLKDDSSVLEVGCGSGILLSHLIKKYKNIKFEGIEPYAGEFEILRKFHQNLENIGESLIIKSYENFTPKKKYDFIFLINVFEHLENWRDFLNFVKTNLNRDGKCLILCPNYSFPFESHFNLPIIFNKSLTYKIFRNNIFNQEKVRNALGLWDSLNFVTYAAVVKECKKINLLINPDNEVFFQMINRVSYDQEFKKRHRITSLLASLLFKMGFLNVFKYEFMRNLDPYMKFTLTLNED